MIFFVLNLLFAAVIWLFYPETSGRTLEEIDNMYAGDCDRLIVVGKNGRTLPGFRSMMDRSDISQRISSQSKIENEISNVEHVIPKKGEVKEDKPKHLEYV